jgi:hypothetical protein
VPKPACAKETGEADPRDRPQKVEFELFLSSILHFYLVHKEARSSSRLCAQVNEKNKSADPCDRPNHFIPYSLFICSIDLMDDGKLGYGFTSADELEEVDIGPNPGRSQKRSRKDDRSRLHQDLQVCRMDF